MTLKKKLIQNSLWLYSSDILGKILSYFLIIAIARNLGETGLGEYSFIFAFASFSLLLSDFGLGYFLVKETSREPSSAGKYFSAIVSMRLVFSSMITLAFAAVSFYLGKPAHVTTGILIILTFNLISSTYEPFLSVLQAHNRVKQIAIANTIERLVAFLAGLYVLWTYKSLVLLIAVLFVSNTLRQMLLFAYARGLVTFRLDFDLRNWTKIIPLAIPFWFTGVFSFIYFRTDTVMLSLMVGDQATGIYNAAYKLTETMMFIPTMLLFVILPSISYFFKQDIAMLKTLVQRALKYLLYIAFPMAIGTFLLADRFIAFIYKEQFAASGPALQVLIIATFFGFMNGLLANVLIVTDRQGYFIRITMALALLNVILNFLLIPRYLYIGSGIATVITQALNFLLLSRYADRWIMKIDYLRITWKPLLASVIMGIVILKGDSLAIWYLVPLGAMAYVIAMAAFGIDKEDRELFKNVF